MFFTINQLRLRSNGIFRDHCLGGDLLLKTGYLNNPMARAHTWHHKMQKKIESHGVMTFGRNQSDEHAR
jgi:hypothetical protein